MPVEVIPIQITTISLIKSPILLPEILLSVEAMTTSLIWVWAPQRLGYLNRQLRVTVCG